MTKIKKGDYWKRTHVPDAEPFEEFDVRKIEMALVRAGVRGTNVEEIAAMVKPFEGMSTDDIDKIVVKELENRDPETAKYWRMMRDFRSGRFKG